MQREEHLGCGAALVLGWASSPALLAGVSLPAFLCWCLSEALLLLWPCCPASCWEDRGAGCCSASSSPALGVSCAHAWCQCPVCFALPALGRCCPCRGGDVHMALTFSPCASLMAFAFCVSLLLVAALGLGSSSVLRLLVSPVPRNAALRRLGAAVLQTPLVQVSSSRSSLWRAEII